MWHFSEPQIILLLICNFFQKLQTHNTQFNRKQKEEGRDDDCKRNDISPFFGSNDTYVYVYIRQSVMFRKPKRKVKQGLRRKDSDDDDKVKNAKDGGSDNDNETSELLSEARKRVKLTTATTSSSTTATSQSSNTKNKTSLLHTYRQQQSEKTSHADLATSTADYHPEALLRGKASDKDNKQANAASAPQHQHQQQQQSQDGIFRNTQRNKFLAGPIKAAANIRVTARFDYEPNICKDYKETGFCGFGDTCIYLHDRGDTLAGWQLEQQWEQQQKKKQLEQEKAMQQFVDAMEGQAGTKNDNSNDNNSADDGLPFACYLCREYFKNPVVTNCNHYFCEKCIMDHVRNNNDNNSNEKCPICGHDTGSVFNQPTKLLAKKRKVLGSTAAAAAKADNSWEEYAKFFTAAAQNAREE